MLYPSKIQMETFRKWNLNDNLYLVQKCIIKAMIKNSNRVLGDTAAEKYSSHTLIWPEHCLLNLKNTH